MKKVGYFLRHGFWALLSLFFLLLILGSFLYIYLESELPDVETLKTVKLQVPLRIYTKEGLLIQEYGEKKRIPLRYEEIPPMLVNAVLATEDQRFFEHPGVDVFGLGRAAINMLQTGTKSQGGSTITMQVARNFFLNRKKTFLRKFNEILLAIRIDQKLSKEKILELYFNKIYLGNRAYGVGAAAQVYYGKPINVLSLAELAMIAGLPQAPSTQNPIANPVAAKKRRDHVLERLLEEKFINEKEFQTAINEPITVKYHGAEVQVTAPYVAEMIRQSLYDHFGPKAYTKGYKVYTTIEGRLQKAANQSVEDNLIAYGRRHGYTGPIANIGNKINSTPKQIQSLLATYPVVNDLLPAAILNVEEHEAIAITRRGEIITLPWEALSWAKPALKNGWVGKAPTQAAQVLSSGDIVYVRQRENQWELTQIPKIEASLVAINPENGSIAALVGGFNFERSKFNRATQSVRQPGSSFKPFIYAAALQKGYTLATLINDAPIVVDDPSQPNLWRPHNDNLTFNGPTRLKEALVRSRNLVSIRVLDDIGISYAINFITRFGFQKSKLPKALSLALGSLSVSPLELTTAYAVFANGGYRIEPFLIAKITDNHGKVLLEAKPTFVCHEPCDQSVLTPDSIAPRVIPEDIAFLMHTALTDVIRQGTAQGAKVLNRADIAGKTGTTNNQVDAWFAGYNPNLVVTTWVGYDNPQPLHEYAARLALPIWIDFMATALKELPTKQIIPPSNIVSIRIRPDSGQPANTYEKNAIIEYFRQDELPTTTPEEVAPTSSVSQNNNVNTESLF